MPGSGVRLDLLSSRIYKHTLFIMEIIRFAKLYISVASSCQEIYMLKQHAEYQDARASLRAVRMKWKA